MWAALICDRFKWTYQEYMETPIDFIFNVQAMMTAEASESKRKNNSKGR